MCRQRLPTTTNHQPSAIKSLLMSTKSRHVWRGVQAEAIDVEVLTGCYKKTQMIWSSCDVRIPWSSNLCDFHGGISLNKINWTRWQTTKHLSKLRYDNNSSRFGDATAIDLFLHHQHNDNLCIYGNMLTQCLYFVHICCTPLKTNMTLENPPFEDVFAIKHNMGIFQMLVVNCKTQEC